MFLKGRDVMRGNVSATRQRFDALDQIGGAPKPLLERKEAARKAWQALAGGQRDGDLHR